MFLEPLTQPADIGKLPPFVRSSGTAVTRADTFNAVKGAHYDVAIFGAGISGARIFHELSRRGYRVLLLDRGDFAGGTSQASGMMIWGGLLYLKDFHFRTVRQLCRARDELIERLPEKVRAEKFRYLAGKDTTRNLAFVRAGMTLYWLLGSLKRRFPGCERRFGGRDLLKAEGFRDSLTFEEAMLKVSDCRFALEWILPFTSGRSAAVNHCAAEQAMFDAQARCWRLELRDRLTGDEATASARFVVNAAGVWTDTLNGQLGLESPYRHELSKGVYISFRRPKSLRQILIFDTAENDDVSTFVPWGPVALCGPTETRVTEIGGHFAASSEDVRWLLRLANRNLRAHYGSGDVISMRSGIRPLAVRRGFSKSVHPLELSRKHLLHYDHARQVLAVYGGKLTSCGLLAGQVAVRLSPHLKAGPEPALVSLKSPPAERFPGLNDLVPSAAWCRDREQCQTLEDYLRRRTNIAQWIPRGGLGRQSENLPALRRIARILAPDSAAAEKSLAAYQMSVCERHDDILAAV